MQSWLDGLKAQKQAAARRRIARKHDCFHFGRAAPISWVAIAPDPMHGVQNVANQILKRFVWKPLRYDAKSTMQLYNLCYTLCNTSLACVMHYTPITHV